MEEIFSESQKRKREKHVSLPYHRPKQRSLNEFLQRRSLVSAVPLRTSIDNLKEVWKQIEEKEKDAETFYKSDESDEEKNDEESKDKGEDLVDVEIKENGNEPLNGTCETLAESSDSNSDLSNHRTAEACNEPNVHISSDKIVSNSENTAFFELHLSNDNSDFGSEVSDPVAVSEIKKPVVESLSEISKVTSSEENSEKAFENENSAEFSLRFSETDLSRCTELEEISIAHCVEKTNKVPKRLNEVANISSQILENNCDKLSPCKKNRSVEENSTSKENTPVKIKSVSNDESRECEFSPKLKQILTSSQADNIPSKTLSPSDRSMSPKIMDKKETEIVSNSVKRHLKFSGGNEKLKVSGESCDLGKQKDDNVTESDPVFSLYLEDSMDCPEVENQCNKNAAKDGNIKVQDPARKIDWMNYKGMSDDESDSEVAIPKLSLKYKPNETILLDNPSSLVNPGVVKLMEKFLKHSTFKSVPKKKQTATQLNIVTATKSDGNKVDGFTAETLTVVLEEETSTVPKNEKPGAKLMKLRTELKEKMAKRRQEEWKKRLQIHKVYEEEEVGDGDEKSTCGGLDDDPDFFLGGTETEDSDLEENDIDLSDKKKKKSAFVDDEAEEDSEDYEESEEEIEISNEDKEIERVKKKADFIKDDEENEYDGDDDNEEENDEDDDEKWLQPGQNKLRSQVSIHGSTTDLTNKADSFCSNDSKHNFSFDLNKLDTSINYDCLTSKTVTTEVNGLDELINEKQNEIITESQVLGLCSGQFQTQPAQLEDEDLDGFVLSPSQDETSSKNMEFSSKIAKKTNVLFSSDEEENPDTAQRRKKKVNLKFSDDEDETKDSISNKNGAEDKVEEQDVKNDEDQDEVEDLDEVDDELDGGNDSNEEAENDDNESVMYDSEENEIVVTKKDVGQFFEKEAELSESDWDSEDEDEKGLDRMDEEAGDMEQIDEDQVQKELGKIHMRNLLDDDQREIKKLQERFLEDGELHSDGKGREKNFKWQNINDEALDAIWRQRRNSEGDEPQEEEEDENEELWRKMRAEKEKFLKKNKNNQSTHNGEDDIDLDESVACQFLQTSKKTVILAKNEPEVKKMIDLDESIIPQKLTSVTGMQTFDLALKLCPRKSSFLSRGTQILNRIGQLGNSTDANSSNVNKNKARKFVFTTVSPTKDDSQSTDESNPVTKRKSAPLSPVASKKPKLLENKLRNPNRRSLLAQLVFD